MTVPWQTFASEEVIMLIANDIPLRGSDFDWVAKKWIVPDKVQRDEGELLEREGTCTKCKMTKSVSEFYKRPEKYSGGRGHSYHCKTCTKKAL